MNMVSVKMMAAMFFGFAPVMAISLGGWALLVTAVCWLISGATVKSLLNDVKKEEQRVKGESTRRSRGCVEKRTRTYYNR